MADGRPFHSKNGRVIVSGVEIEGASTWSANTAKDVVEATQFNDRRKRNVPGQLSDAGSITAWQYADKRTLLDAVRADGPVSLYLYPDRNDATNYLYGFVIMTSRNLEASTAAAFGGTADYVNFDNNGLTVMGFS